MKTTQTTTTPRAPMRLSTPARIGGYVGTDTRVDFPINGDKITRYRACHKDRADRGIARGRLWERLATLTA